MAEVELLDSEEQIAKVDRSGMLAVVGQLPEMVEQAERYSAGVDLPKAEAIRQILVLGMGGSAISGDIFSDLYLRKIKYPIVVNRSHSLPEFVDKGTLVFALSYSGNTEEVISAVKEAEKRDTRVICITSGGKLKEIAAGRNYPLFLIPTGYQPRSALPLLLIPLLSSLETMGIIPPAGAEIKEAALVLRKMKDEIGPGKPARNNTAKQLAKKMAGKIPVIFGVTGTTASAALRLKNQISENSKLTSVLNNFPELNHNEIVNLSNRSREEHNFVWLVFRDEADGERVKKGIEIIKSLLGKQMGGVNEIVSYGKSPIARALSLIFFGDYLSVYLAIQRGVDPTPVDIIGRLKKEIMR